MLPYVSRRCAGLVSKLVSVTVSLTTARVREGLSILFSIIGLRGVDTIAAEMTLVDQLI